MRVRSILAVTALLAAVAALVTAAPGCGKSALATAYAAYNPKVEQWLDTEPARWKKLVTLFTAQFDDAADVEAYARYVATEAVPFYDDLHAKVADLRPGDPGLEAAHAQLLKAAEARSRFAHVLLATVEILRRDEVATKVAVKSAALDTAKDEYGMALKDAQAASVDSRFTELAGVSTEFGNAYAALGEGRATAEEVKEGVEKRVLPEIRRLRATKFGDDEASRKLRGVVAAAEEFFSAMIPALPRAEASARLKNESQALAKAGEDAFQKFREEMKLVRARK